MLITDPRKHPNYALCSSGLSSPSPMLDYEAFLRLRYQRLTSKSCCVRQQSRSPRSARVHIKIFSTHNAQIPGQSKKPKTCWLLSANCKCTEN